MSEYGEPDPIDPPAQSSLGPEEEWAYFGPLFIGKWLAVDGTDLEIMAAYEDPADRLRIRKKVSE